MASCLARNGASVIIVDADTHPRFAIGESTIPYTSMMMRMVSERYNVPEIKWLTTFEAVQSKVTTTAGVKRNFGFVYHRPGQPQVPRETNMFAIPKILHTESHYFRQDIDNFMVQTAVKYGADLRQQVKIRDIAFDADGVTIEHDRGAPFRAKFIVDAGGFRSPLAEKLDLREQPSRLEHHSRSLFTHMIGVRPYDEIATKKQYGHPSPWHEGTLHHVFPGGWIWVIPFDNHPRAVNPLCSVGVQLDPRVHPVPDCTPEEEFRRILAQFPGIAPQFENSQTVRDWIRTDRLQYSPKQTVGYRWCLTSHAAGFIDPLFSRGMSNTMEIVNALVQRLLDAIKEDDFSVERFQYVQDIEQGQLDFNDNLVANAYTSFVDWDLWDAWYRVWVLTQALTNFEVNRAYAKFLDTRDPAVLQRLEKPWWRVTMRSFDPDAVIEPDHKEVLNLLGQVDATMAAVRRGETEPKQAAAQIMTALAGAKWAPPVFGVGDPNTQWTHPTFGKVMRTLWWARRSAPPEIGKLTYEGLTLFMKKRFARGEFQLGEEFKQAAAGWPVIGRRLRLPDPK